MRTKKVSTRSKPKWQFGEKVWIRTLGDCEIHGFRNPKYFKLNVLIADWTDDLIWVAEEDLEPPLADADKPRAIKEQFTRYLTHQMSNLSN